MMAFVLGLLGAPLAVEAQPARLFDLAVERCKISERLPNKRMLIRHTIRTEN